MEAEPQRWAVMYTKHVKQKRKAYQDGALVLHPASGLLVLLDDAGGTVECRFLRTGEDVSPGASLAFQRHLVDVGEPDRNPTCYSGSGTSAAASASRVVHRGGARPRPSAVNSRVPRAFVNPTTKGSGGKDEAAGPSGAEGEDSGLQEWTALYTTHLTQKAKKYHDGVVRLVQVGSHAKQIVLLDEDGEVLGIRYLKSGESVESGKKCHFPSYLIEICEARSEKKGVEPNSSEKPMVQTRPRSGENTSNKMGSGPTSKSLRFISPQKFHDLEESKSENTAGSSKPETAKIEVVAAGTSGNIMGSTDSGFKEWNALYTTQLIQKAKKYHDGVIKLMQVGSHAKLIVLLDEEGGVLGSRYLKSGESVESGMKCQLSNYLIEVCEIREQKNDVEPKHFSEEASSTTDRTDDRNKSPKFVSPIKFNHLRKSILEHSTGCNRPPATQSIYTNMDGTLKFHDIQKGKPGFTAGCRRRDLGKSTFSNFYDPQKLNVFADDERAKTECAANLQGGKSVCSTSFIRRDVGKSTFGNMDDSLRTASQILSIMKPPSEIKYSQSIPTSQAHSSASFGSNMTLDADRNKTASNVSAINDSNRTIGGNRNSGLSHCATQLRMSVQACLNLETPQTKSSVSTHHRNELPGNAHPTYDYQTIMSPVAFDSLELDTVDIPAFDLSNAKEQRQGSSGNHQTGSSNDSAPAIQTTIPSLPRDKSETADQLSANRVAGEKCGSYPFLSASDLTLIDDCPSFDLGF